MDILNSLSGLFGVIVAAVSVYFIYKSRADQYKNELYSQQIKAVLDLTSSLYSVQIALNHIPTDEKIFFIDDDKQRKIIKKKLKEPKNELREKLIQCSPILPPKVFSSFTEYIALIELSIGEMSSAPENSGNWRNCLQHSPWETLQGQFVSTIMSIRDFLGVGPLSQSIEQVIGGKRKDEDKELLRNAWEILRLLQYQYDKPYLPELGIGGDDQPFQK